MKNIALVLVILVVTGAFASLIWAAGSVKSIPVAGIYEQVLEEAGFAPVRYTVAFPAYNPSRTIWSLIVALHYGGTVTPFFGAGMLHTLVRPALNDLGAVLVAPDCPGDGWSDAVSEQAVDRLVKHLLKTLPIDRKRVLLVGYSMGAMGIWHLAQKADSPYAAGIAIAGIPRSGEVPKALAFPIFAMASERDEVFPFARIQEYVSACQKAGLAVEFKSMPDIGHYEIERYVSALRQTKTWIAKAWGK